MVKKKGWLSSLSYIIIEIQLTDKYYHLCSVQAACSDSPPLLKPSPPEASTLSSRPPCTWGRGWQSYSLPANRGGYPLWWTVAPSIHRELSGVRIHPLQDAREVTLLQRRHGLPTRGILKQREQGELETEYWKDILKERGEQSTD